MQASNYEDVLAQLRAGGLIVDHLRIGESRPVRTLVQDGGRERRGWYSLHELPMREGGMLIVGSFGVWRGNDNHAQKVEIAKRDQLTSDQLEAMRAKWEADRKRAERELQAQQAQAARRAEMMWRRLATEGDSPYLTAKGIDDVERSGLRYTPNGTAVLPMMDPAGKIHGLQFLRTAAQARAAKRPAKEFWPRGLAKKGHFHTLGHIHGDDIVLVAEGYATAATLHLATKHPVAVAFDAGNLLPVAKAIRKRHKRARILICADDDQFRNCRECKQPVVLWTHPVQCPGCGKEHGGQNEGVTAASAAALAVDGAWIQPHFDDPALRLSAYYDDGRKLTDFNDLHTLDPDNPRPGIDAVQRQVEGHLEHLGWIDRKPAAVSSSTPGGGDALRPVETMDELLQRYALVYAMNGAVFDRREHCLLSLADMKNACIRGELHKAWMEHNARSIVRKDCVGFDPTERDPRISCNLWSGWPTLPQQGRCERLLALLQYLCSAERDGHRLYEWVLRWLAYPLQHPGAKMKTCIVVHGPQGTGKNLFFEAVKGIYGRFGMVLDQVALSDKHNDWASAKLFVVCDEVVAQADRFDLKNRLKGLISGDTLRINPKHIAAYEERNHVNLVFLSNEAMPVVLEEDDRRHCVIWTPSHKPPDYYAAVQAEIDSGGIAALHDYLLRLDLGDFHRDSKPPETAAKRELIKLGLDSPLEFVDALQVGDVAGMKMRPGLTTDWYAAYGVWCHKVGIKPASMKRFVNAIERRRGVRSERKRWLNIQTTAGPHCAFLWGCAPPEGTAEAVWLGEEILNMRQELSAYRGHTT